MKNNTAKMKNKGFTLVELLAVIVVLSIILLIAIPGITGLIEKSKEDSIVKSMRMMEEATKIYVTRESIEIPEENEIKVIPLLELIAKDMITNVVHPSVGDETCEGAVVITGGRIPIYEAALRCVSAEEQYGLLALAKVYEVMSDTALEYVEQQIRADIPAYVPEVGGIKTVILDEEIVTDPMDEENLVIVEIIIEEITGEVIAEEEADIIIEIESDTYKVEIESSTVTDQTGEMTYFVDGDVVAFLPPEPDPNSDVSGANPPVLATNMLQFIIM